MIFSFFFHYILKFRILLLLLFCSLKIYSFFYKLFLEQFMRNNNLFRNRIFLFVIVFIISLFNSFGANHATWWDFNFEGRVQVDISTNSSSTVSDFQVRINLNDSNLGPSFNWSNNCNDIRVLEDSDTLLNYWIRTCNTTSKQIELWTKIPSSINTSINSLFIYYDNQNVLSLSNGSLVFDFFDDFENGLGKWSNYKNSGNIAINSGVLEIVGGTTSSPYGHSVIGTGFIFNTFLDGIIEGDLFLSTNSIAEISFRGNFSSNTGYKSRIDARSGQGLSHLKPPYTDGSWGFLSSCSTTGVTPSINSWIDFQIIVTSSSFTINSESNSRTCSDTQYPNSGEISLQNHYGTSAYYDNIRVRKYFSNSILINVHSNESLYEEINTCQNLNSNSSYKLISNILDYSGDCFILTGDNILLNGEFNIIDGLNNGEAITTNNNYIDNVIILNSNISDFSTSILIFNSTNFLVKDSVINSPRNYAFDIGDFSTRIPGCNSCIFENISILGVEVADAISYVFSSNSIFSNITLSGVGNGNGDYTFYLRNVNNFTFENINAFNSRDSFFYIEDSNIFNFTNLNLNLTISGNRDAFTIMNSSYFILKNINLFNIYSDLIDVNYNSNFFNLENFYGESIGNGDGFELRYNSSNWFINNVTIDVTNRGFYCEDDVANICNNITIYNFNILQTQVDDGFFIENSNKFILINATLNNIGDLNDQGLAIYSSSNVYLNNLKIRGNLQEGIFVNNNLPQNYTLKNIYIENTSQEGIQFASGLIKSNFLNITINKTGSDGIDIGDVGYFNKFEDIKIFDFGNGDGIRINSDANNTIMRDIFISGGLDDGIELRRNSLNSTFENITIYNVFDIGFICTNSGGVFGCPNSTFRNIKIVNTTTDDGIYLLNSPKIKLENIYLKNIGGDTNRDYGIYTTFSRNSMYNNISLINSGDGIYISNDAQYSNYTNILIENLTNSTNGFRIGSDSMYNNIINVSIVNVNRDLSGNSYGGGLYIGSNSGNNFIKNLYINKTDNYAVYIVSSPNNILEDINLYDIGYTSTNSYKPNSRGIYVTGNSHNISIINSSLKYISDLCLYVDGENVNLNSLKINYCENDGILLSSTDYGFRAKNVFVNNTLGDGIFIGSSRNTSLFENIFVGNTLNYGIYLSTRSEPNVHYKNISVINTGAGYYGFYLIGDSGSTLENISIKNSGYMGLRVQNLQNSEFKNILIENSNNTGFYLQNSDYSTIFNLTTIKSNYRGFEIYSTNYLNISFSDFRNNRAENIRFQNSANINISFSHMGRNSSKLSANNNFLNSLFNITTSSYGLGNWWSNDLCRSARSDYFNSKEYYVCTSDDVILYSPTNRIDYSPLIYNNETFNIEYSSLSSLNNSLVCGSFDVQLEVSNILERSTMLNLNNDVIGYFAFEDVSSNLSSDIFGSGLNASLVNGVQVLNTSRIRGNYLELDGSNDYISLGDLSQIDGATKLSGVAWIRLDDLNKDNTIISKDVFAAGSQLLFWRDDLGAVFGRQNTLSILISGGVDARIEGSNNILNDNLWHHVAFTFEANNSQGLRLYIDGVEDLNSPVSTIGINSLKSNSNNLLIGNSITSGKEFDGGIDEVALVNRVLSLNEIKSLYNENLYNFNTTISIDSGTYNYNVCGNNYDGNVLCSNSRNVIALNSSISNFSVIAPINKYISKNKIPVNFIVDSNISNVSYYLNSNSSNKIAMNSLDFRNWSATISNLDVGDYNITFSYYGNCGIEEIYYGGEFTYISNESLRINKSFSSLSSNLLIVKINVENNLNFTQNITVFDFIDSTTPFGSFNLI